MLAGVAHVPTCNTPTSKALNPFIPPHTCLSAGRGMSQDPLEGAGPSGRCPDDPTLDDPTLEDP